MSGGYAKYLREAVPPLAERPEISALLILAFPAAVAGIQRLERSTVHAVGRFYRPLSRWMAPEITDVLARFRPDVLFIPNFRLLLGTKVPQVVMARNMEPLAWNDAPDPARQRIVNRARRLEGRLAAWRADRIIAVSGYVRDHLEGRWKVPVRKVGVIYHGVGPLPAASRPHALADVAPGFVFTAGSTRPSRGLEDVIEAFARIRPSRRCTLVIAGRADPIFVRFEADLQRRTARLGGAVIWAGSLSPAEMAWCYDNSGVFVMTSRVEACPNIALEAMSRSCAVVSSDDPPLPEFFAGSAVYYPARDVDRLARILEPELHTPEASQARRALAGARARAFSWSATAERTARILGAAAAGDPYA